GLRAGAKDAQGLESSIVYFQGSASMSFAEQLTRLQVFLDADES
ncbi:hypothetical protein Pgy4_39168, partial [Pseudomonas savastanoi pv. glycinea str. race 4]